MRDTSQDQVFNLLADPATHGGQPVERIDTHISAVFLAGDRVWKLKKAVRLPFLDFSTAELRHAACEAELAVNRPLAPDLYLGLAAVTRQADGGLAVDGPGQPVDWLVVMRRFDQACQFDRLALAGRLTRAHVVGLTGQLARAHAAAAPRHDQGGAEAMAWIIDNGGECFATHVPGVFAADAVADLVAAQRRALAEHSGLLAARRHDGKVRRGHGDLHLANVCLHDGHPTAFDAIEFSEALGCVDVLYDLAFLVMDLVRYGQKRLASFALNHYLDHSGEWDGLPVLPLFLSCRAAVRAHVSASIAAAIPDLADRARRLEAARDYFALARALLVPAPARLVAVGGLSGSGKSRMARELAPFLGTPPGAVVLRTDVLRKRLAGLAPETPLPPEAYTAEASRRTYDELGRRAGLLLAAGYSVVADAVFARADERDAIAGLAKRAGLPFAGAWLEADPAVMAARIAGRQGNASDATVAVLESQLGYDLGRLDWARVDTSASREASVAAARAVLGI